MLTSRSSTFFFFNDTATTEIYTLSLHDALPISTGMTYETDGGYPFNRRREDGTISTLRDGIAHHYTASLATLETRSEEHTSELQSLAYLVCRLLLEKKKKKKI